MKHPDRNQCYEYLKEKNTPQHVVGHCKSVAAVAYILGRALNEAGGTKAVPFGEIKFKKTKFTQSGREHYMQDPSCKAVGTAYRDFDLELVLASGLLHDIARKEERHWDVGADFCKNLNLPEEENIIRIHMQYEFTNDEQNLTEADLVCLGDRLSIEDRYVGLDKRMDYIIDKAIRHGHPEAAPVIMRKKEVTRQLLNGIEKRIGCSIDELMNDIDYENIEGTCNDNR
ncbi:MAG: HD domain-containing protein [Firmicutes bacterium]|nr:HD domain-containing protein [Bacillota bacterium]